jgi:hypothetical protein
VVRIAKSRLSGKELKKFKRLIAQYKKELEELMKNKEAVAQKVPQEIRLVSYIGGEHGERTHN